MTKNVAQVFSHLTTTYHSQDKDKKEVEEITVNALPIKIAENTDKEESSCIVI